MPLIDAKTLAKELGFSAKFIRRLAHRGQIPSMRFGSEYRFDLQAVKAAAIYVDHIAADAHRAAQRAQLRSNMRKPVWPKPGPGRQKKGPGAA